MGELQVYPNLESSEAFEYSSEAEAMIVVGSEVSGDLLARAPRLAYVGVLSTGYDFVDVNRAREMGIVVTNVPTYGTASVAQYTFALILELCHQVGRHHETVISGDWTRSGRFSLLQTIDHANNHKDGEGYDHKIDDDI